MLLMKKVKLTLVYYTIPYGKMDLGLAIQIIRNVLLQVARQLLP